MGRKVKSRVLGSVLSRGRDTSNPHAHLFPSPCPLSSSWSVLAVLLGVWYPHWGAVACCDFMRAGPGVAWGQQQGADGGSCGGLGNARCQGGPWPRALSLQAVPLLRLLALTVGDSGLVFAGCRRRCVVEQLPGSRAVRALGSFLFLSIQILL